MSITFTTGKPEQFRVFPDNNNNNNITFCLKLFRAECLGREYECFSMQGRFMEMRRQCLTKRCKCFATIWK